MILIEKKDKKSFLINKNFKNYLFLNYFRILQEKIQLLEDTMKEKKNEEEEKIDYFKAAIQNLKSEKFEKIKLI